MKVRNFTIIAHIDHGKSTLADRFIELSGAIRPEKHQEQLLDSMDLEREKGITIKMHPVRLKVGEYIFHLIDTPGHVDFSYEVSRSLAAVEGAILLVDASQGVEAQTISNLYLALEQNLEIIPVINKIDLPNADIEGTMEQLKDLLGNVEISLISAKTGKGVPELIERIIRDIPPPRILSEETICLVFDALWDDHRGAIPFVRVFGGEIKRGDRIEFVSSSEVFEVLEVGYIFPPKRFVPAEKLVAGDVGYIVANIRDIRSARVGDTIRLAGSKVPPLPGYREAKPMVWAGIFPINNEDYNLLSKAIEKLKLNDASIYVSSMYSPALGPGFKCGFLGLLHLEIFKERLRREFNVDIIVTTPSVEYKVVHKDGREEIITNPTDFPDYYEKAYEPYVKLQILTPPDYIGPIMQMVISRRGKQLGFHYLGGKVVVMEFEIPLSEILYDFFDTLKSISRGYASMDYELIGWKESDLVRLDILINGDKVDAFGIVVPREKAYHVGRKLVEKLRELIPRQLFEVNIQAAISKRVIAKERIPPIRKDVTAKCYGGDVTRKRKLLERQKEGKKKLKQIGKVEVPQEAFMALLSSEKGKGND